MQPVQINWPAASTTAIAAAQTLGAAGALTINGPLVINASLPAPNVAQMPDVFNRKVTLTSTGNLSAVNFTITGYDNNFNVVTELLTGPNNSTVTSVNNYYQITSIMTSAAVATAVSVGTGSTGVTAWILGNTYPAPISAGLYIGVTANTINVTVEGTPDDPGTVASPQLFTHSYLNAITANDSSEWPYGFRYLRFKVNSSDATGAARFTVIQAGY